MTEQNPTEKAVHNKHHIKNGTVNNQYHQVAQSIKIIDKLANVILAIDRLIKCTMVRNGKSIKPTNRLVNG